MRLMTILASTLFLLTSSVALADAYKQVERTCPPASALRHNIIGQPWTLDAPYITQGWYVVQDYSDQDSLTSFKGGRAGGMSVYLNDDGISGPSVTCYYESGDDAKIFVKSVYPYAPYSNMPPPGAKFYWNSKLNAYECDLGGFDQNGNTYSDLNECKWIAADFSKTTK